MIMMRILGVLLVTVVLSACNTMKGMGQDIERGGEKIQDSADRNKNK
jgi:predicted small secreted protein